MVSLIVDDVGIQELGHILGGGSGRHADAGAAMTRRFHRKRRRRVVGKLMLHQMLIRRLTLKDVRRRHHERTGIQLIHDTLQSDVRLSNTRGINVHTERCRRWSSDRRWR